MPGNFVARDVPHAAGVNAFAEQAKKAGYRPRTVAAGGRQEAGHVCR
jgi:hypothetical protein